jgi:hypothetical protein
MIIAFKDDYFFKKKSLRGLRETYKGLDRGVVKRKYLLHLD